MENLNQWVERSDPIIWTIVVIGILGTLLISAWTLNLSCRLCRLEPPGFVRALLMMVAISISGAIASVWMEMASDSLPMWVSVSVNFGLPIGVICFMLPTDPVTAFLVTFVQGIIWFFVGIVLVVGGFLFIQLAMA